MSSIRIVMNPTPRTTNMDPDTTPSASNWPELVRKRRAIVVVDVVESVRLMQANEADVIDRWRRFVSEVRTQVLPTHGGRLVKSLGDGLLLEFESVHEAVAAAVELGRSLLPFNVDRGRDAHMLLRVGVHVADVVIDEFDVYGSGVNLTARIASLGQPGEIVVSAEVRDCLVKGLDPDLLDLGDCYVKHLSEPVRAYKIQLTQAGYSGAESSAPSRINSFVPTLIVMPAVTETADELMVADVMTASIGESLSASGELRVIAKLSADALRGRASIPNQYLNGLGADFALVSTCRVSSGWLVVSFELLETRRGTVVWSGQGKERLGDLLQPGCPLVRHVSQSVAAALLRLETTLGVSQPLPSLPGHAIQVGAISMMHRSSTAEFESVRDRLEYLIDRHNRVASPRAWLAKWYVLRVTRGVVSDPASEAGRALEQTRRALDADPDCALALAMEGFVFCHMLRDLSGAAERLDRAVEVGPNEPLAWLFRGVVHAFCDEGERAVACTEHALALSPIDPLKYYLDSLAAAAAVAAGDCDRAIALAQRSLASNVLHSSTYRTLAIAQSLRGDGTSARETVRRMLAIDPGFSVERFMSRVPSGASPIAQRFAQALADAGAPRSS